MRFVMSQNLPDGEVCFIAVSAEEPDVIAYLQACGIEAAPVQPCEALPRGLRSHADLQLLHFGGNELLAAP